MISALYVHIPFCKQKCKYCDFASFAGRENQISTYLDALAREASSVALRRFDTLYIGGGTPSLLSVAQWEKLVRLLEENFGPVSRYDESTVEANPESLTKEKLIFLRQSGFNRLSIGLQSFDDKLLSVLGRVHTVADFLKAYQTARESGFDNISVDVMAGLPQQTFEMFANGLNRLAELRPEHISVYGLQIEEGTPFFMQGVTCDQELMRRMLEYTHERLIQAGYHHYEISNFALKGRESRHNSHYWRYGRYIGLGSAAASFTGGIRRQNTADISAYIQKITAGQSAVEFQEHLTGVAREGEKMLLALRQLDGVVPSVKAQQFFNRALEEHIRRGLLVRDGKKVKLSNEGLYLANEVFRSFVAPFDEL